MSTPFNGEKLIQVYSYDCFNLQAHSFSTGVLPLMIPLAFLLNMVRNINVLMHAGYPTKFYAGEALPQGPTFTLLYTIVDRKSTC